VEFVGDGDEAAVDGDGGGGEVDVGPAQPEEFAAAHAGAGGQPQSREQAMTSGRPQEGPQFLRGPGLLFDLGDRAQPRGLGEEGDVARHEPFADGVAEGAADDEVHIEHGLCSERLACVGRVQHPVVERPDLRGAQAPDADATQTRNDVALDLAAVAVPRAGGQGDLLAWQPPRGQVSAEAQSTTLVVAAVDRGGTSCRASCSASARSVPAACQLRRSRLVTGSSLS
jgi:hypothetical protein